MNRNDTSSVSLRLTAFALPPFVRFADISPAGGITLKGKPLTGRRSDMRKNMPVVYFYRIARKLPNEWE